MGNFDEHTWGISVSAISGAIGDWIEAATREKCAAERRKRVAANSLKDRRDGNAKRSTGSLENE